MKKNILLPVMFLLFYSLTISCDKDENKMKSAELRPTYASIQKHVFNKYCTESNCHSGAAVESQLNLEDGQAYKNLVNDRSTQIQNLYLVKPNHPDSSYLIRKLENRKIVGEPMPMKRSALHQDTIDVIRKWITNGAHNN